MAHILVAGGAGFIGTHLCGRLLRDGHQVTCVDNLSSGSLDNIQAFMGSPDFRFIQQSVTQSLSLSVNQIFNLASPASPVDYQRSPIDTMLTNVVGSMQLLELARKCSARILLASTSEVYGDPEHHPQEESYRGSVNACGPRACYDEGKRAAEALFFDYHRLYGVDTKVVRIFNTYGPRMAMTDGRVVSNFIVQALRGELLTVYGTGNQTRSFQFVDDLVEGMIRMMGTPFGRCGPVNLGNPEEVRVSDLAGKIIVLTGGASRIQHLPLPVDDPKRRCPDISLARRLLSWEPQTSLDQGLIVTIRYFTELLRAAAQNKDQEANRA